MRSIFCSHSYFTGTEMDAGDREINYSIGLDLETDSEGFNSQPERSLFFALIQDAISALKERTNKFTKDRSRIEAAVWIENNDEEYLFSFNNACYIVGIDPSFLRNKLRKLY